MLIIYKKKQNQTINRNYRIIPLRPLKIIMKINKTFYTIYKVLKCEVLITKNERFIWQQLIQLT